MSRSIPPFKFANILKRVWQKDQKNQGNIERKTLVPLLTVRTPTALLPTRKIVPIGSWGHENSVRAVLVPPRCNSDECKLWLQLYAPWFSSFGFWIPILLVTMQINFWPSMHNDILECQEVARWELRNLKGSYVVCLCYSSSSIVFCPWVFQQVRKD